MFSEKTLKDVALRFDIDGSIDSVTPLDSGVINYTFLVETQPDSSGNVYKYILQQKNHIVFKDVPQMMNNIFLVTQHLKAKVLSDDGDPMREVLTVIKRCEERITDQERMLPFYELYYRDHDDNYWTMYLFIEDSLTYEKANTPELAFKGGQGIGRFQSYLADFEEPLYETIPGFHNIRMRLEQWDESIRRDAVGRVKSVKNEISWIASRREAMLAFWTLVEDGVIPKRVTHNDTKISNILFDKKGDVLCVIDLDTCMVSTSLNDFGDAIRTFTNTGSEDDHDLDNVGMSLEMYTAYTEGYLAERLDTLSEIELDNLAFSALYITFEQVLRFLMDYIDGDVYYKTKYPEHNLVRARAQYKLLCSMEEQYQQMKDVVYSKVN